MNFYETLLCMQLALVICIFSHAFSKLVTCAARLPKCAHWSDARNNPAHTKPKRRPTFRSLQWCTMTDVPIKLHWFQITVYFLLRPGSIQQCQSTEGNQLIVEIRLESHQNHSTIAQLYRQPLLYAQRGSQCDKHNLLDVRSAHINVLQTEHFVSHNPAQRCSDNIPS